MSTCTCPPAGTPGEIRCPGEHRLECPMYPPRRNGWDGNAFYVDCTAGVRRVRNVTP